MPEKKDALAEIEEAVIEAAEYGCIAPMYLVGRYEECGDCSSCKARKASKLLPRLREVVEAARVLTKQQWTGKPDEYRPVDPRAMCAYTLDLALKFVMLEGGPDGA